MIERLSGTRGDVFGIYHDEGVPEDPELEACGLQTLTRFHLGLRAEPSVERGRGGELSVYHDLVTSDLGFLHRLAAAPARIPAGLAAIVRVEMPVHIHAHQEEQACPQVASS